MLSGSILIVDDEASLLDFLSVLCTGEGLSVTTARSVREAREQLAERTPDLVLCDMMMPDGNGLELLKEIKGGDSRTSVIMMTGPGPRAGDQVLMNSRSKPDASSRMTATLR